MVPDPHLSPRHIATAAEPNTHREWLEGDGVAGLVSVVTPTRNRAHFLAELAEAILAQTHRPLEWLLADDGSSDGTAQVVDQIGQRWAGIDGVELRALSQPQRGAAAARNLALRQARGELIQFLDSDDLLCPAKLASQAAALSETTRADVAYGPWRELFGAGSSRRGPLRQRRPRADEHAMLCGYLSGTWYCPCHSYLFKRAVVRRIGAWDERLDQAQDSDYLIRTLLSGARFVHVPAAEVAYRLHGEDRIGCEAHFRDHFASVLEVARSSRRLLEEGDLIGAYAGEVATKLRDLEDAALIRGHADGVRLCRNELQNLLGARSRGTMSLTLRRALVRSAKRTLAKPIRRTVGDRAVSWARAALREPAATLRDLLSKE
jgi:glycosyltransferase involved in cell wall biosynthesis